jgi:hypothetical protein
MTVSEDIKVIRESQIRMETTCIGCKEKIDNHEKTLYGNGRSGLKTKVAIMWWVLGAIGLLGTAGGGFWVFVNVIAPHVAR